MPEPTSAEVILAATIRAIAERGPGKLTMSAVAATAGVSRPTLYRWFPTKEDLFAALTDYAEQRFDLGLRATVDAHRTPARRLDAALRYLVLYHDPSMGADPIGVDPAYALQGLAGSLPPHVDALVGLLGDAFDVVPAVRSGALSRQDVAELLLRLAYSHYLVPHADPEHLLSTMRRLLALDRRATTTRVAG